MLQAFYHAHQEQMFCSLVTYACGLFSETLARLEPKAKRKPDIFQMSFFDLKTVFPTETIPKTPKTVLTNFKLKTWFSGRRKRCPTVLSQIAAFGFGHQMLKPRVGWELKKSMV